MECRFASCFAFPTPPYLHALSDTNIVHWNCQLLPGFLAKPAVAVACIQPASLALTVSVSMATPLPESCLFESGSEFNLENRNMQKWALGQVRDGKTKRSWCVGVQCVLLKLLTLSPFYASKRICWLTLCIRMLPYISCKIYYFHKKHLLKKNRTGISVAKIDIPYILASYHSSSTVNLLK